ncbi:Cytochrome oxidase biogenesis protein Sco1/SenC/PrrC, putative copper metallochaperone [hydrothermal vent metagenome]|uniref:Cytochrome oxidase biogenesis protein Sco1/SenC/PrrC, putative copper metallochaperone n=1 Tax=hydrothermal vent metagenome TaxID=652676 RepID=A0A3B1C150_9ZZZZ
MKQLQMIFVSVDPGRDQARQLQDYVYYFDPAFIGITGNLDEIDKLVNQAGILYGYEDEDENTGNYVVNHSTQILLFDPQARLYAILSPPFESETIVHDLQSIQQYLQG